MKQRPQRLEQAIRRAIGQQLVELFPALHLTVTNVQVTPDAQFATVWISSLTETDGETVLEQLQPHHSQLRRAIKQTAQLRRLPGVEFRFDASGRQVQELFREQ